MKTVLFIVLFVLNSISHTKAQALVNGKYTRRQLESMTVTRWGKFIPKWYYILFHNKYRKGEDRRTMRQLLPTALALSVTEAQSDSEKEDSDQLYRQALWISANRTLESHYHLYFKPKFQKLNAEIDALLLRLSLANADLSVSQTFLNEQLRLKGQIDILRDGFLTQGESTSGFQEILDEMHQLKGMIRSYIGYQEIMNKYTQP
jgi:hypothetical protein